VTKERDVSSAITKDGVKAVLKITINEWSNCILSAQAMDNVV
jgi:hypothetical protein